MMQETEKYVLARIIADAGFRAEVTTFLKSQDFVSEECRKVYREIEKLMAKNESVDRLILTERVGVDIGYLFDKIDPSLDLLEASKRIAREGNRYRIKVLFNNFISESNKKDFDFDKQLELLQKELNNPGDSIGGEFGSDALYNFWENMGARSQVVGKTGVEKIDEILEGLEQTHVYSIIAAPGVGKSMMGVQIFDESMKLGTACMYVTNEMNSGEVVSRLLARRTSISSLNIRRDRIHDHQRDEFMTGVDKLDQLFKTSKSVIFDKAHDPDKVYRGIRYWVAKNNIKLIVIDHLHNFKGKVDIFDRISEIAHKLQEIAQELNVAMVILAQISLESQKQKDIEMMTAKGAKDVEEVSNVMIALKRRRVKVNELSVKKEDDPNYMRIIVTKNRDGRTGETGSYVFFPSMVINQDKDDTR